MTASADDLRLDWCDGNAIALLQTGADFFPALCQAIDAARQSVHLETYIFTLDRTGRQVMDCLARAARRGVKVRLVLDGFGSQETVDAVRERMVSAGGQFRVFRPEPRWFGWLRLSRSRLRRLHRKLAVVDGEIAFVGGINIVDDYDDREPGQDVDAPRLDFAVAVRGPMVPRVHRALELLWVRLNWMRLGRRPRDWRWLRLLPRRSARAAPHAGALRAALVLRDNLRHRKTFERAYLHGIAQARREILIANAYFFPGHRFRKALLAAAARGVRVRLLLQGRPEYRLQYHATRALYDQLLASGVEVYEYMPGYLHAKVAVIDGMASVGSSNLDPFSLLLALEANVVVDDAGFAADLQQRLETALAEGGQRVMPREYRRRGLLRRSMDAVSYTLLRIGVALTGKASEF